MEPAFGSPRKAEPKSPEENCKTVTFNGKANSSFALAELSAKVGLTEVLNLLLGTIEQLMAETRSYISSLNWGKIYLSVMSRKCQIRSETKVFRTWEFCPLPFSGKNRKSFHVPGASWHSGITVGKICSFMLVSWSSTCTWWWSTEKLIIDAEPGHSRNGSNHLTRKVGNFPLRNDRKVHSSLHPCRTFANDEKAVCSLFANNILEKCLHDCRNKKKAHTYTS